jgi:hypothetical protein
MGIIRSLLSPRPCVSGHVDDRPMAGESGETCFIQSPNPSNPGTVGNRGEGRRGARREDHRSRLPGYVPGRREACRASSK